MALLALALAVKNLCSRLYVTLWMEFMPYSYLWNLALQTHSPLSQRRKLLFCHRQRTVTKVNWPQWLHRYGMSRSMIGVVFSLPVSAHTSHINLLQHWACALGKLDSTLTLYQCDRTSLDDVNNDGMSPLNLARAFKHKHLVVGGPLSPSLYEET